MSGTSGKGECFDGFLPKLIDVDELRRILIRFLGIEGK